MEEIASPQIGKGFHIGVHNSRGAHRLDEGGQQERELAGKYRAWAGQLHVEYPYVGGILECIAASYDREASGMIRRRRLRRGFQLRGQRCVHTDLDAACICPLPAGLVGTRAGWRTADRGAIILSFVSIASTAVYFCCPIYFNDPDRFSIMTD